MGRKDGGVVKKKGGFGGIEERSAQPALLPGLPSKATQSSVRNMSALRDGHWGNKTAWILRKRRRNTTSSWGRGLARGRAAPGVDASSGSSAAPPKKTKNPKPALPHRPPAPAPRPPALPPAMMARPAPGLSLPKYS